MADLRSLDTWDFEPDHLPRMRQRIQERAEYAAAVRRLAWNMARDTDENQALADLLRDAGRTVAGLAAAHLGLSGGVTLPRLKALMAGFGLTSPGRVRALLSLMRHLRYVEPDPEAPQARPARFRLTGRFIEAYVQHQRSVVEAAALVEPGARRVLDNLDQLGVLARLVAEQTDLFMASTRLDNPFERWFAIFMHRHAGIQMMHALIAEAPSFPPPDRLQIRMAETARRLRVSRVHIAKMLADGQDAGYVEVERGALSFTKSGCEALHWVYSGRLCLHLAAIARTVNGLPWLRLDLAKPFEAVGSERGTPAQAEQDPADARAGAPHHRLQLPGSAGSA